MITTVALVLMLAVSVGVVIIAIPEEEQIAHVVTVSWVLLVGWVGYDQWMEE